MKTNSTVLDRKMVRKRHKLTIGYLVFYAGMLALASMGLSFLLGATAGTASFAIPAFLYDSVAGMLYIYNAVSLILLWLFALLFPGIYQFTGLSDNSWNMLYKLNVKPGGLVLNKIRICIFSYLGIYMMGFIFATLIGYLKSSDKAIDIMMILYMALIGILALLAIVTPTLAVGAVSKGKALLRLTILGTGGIVAFFTYSCGYFNCARIEDVQNSVRQLISINPLGLLIVPALFTLVFPIITYSTAVSRARNYNIEELDDDLLVSLGVDENMLVLEEGRNKFNVTISGPDLNDADFSIEAPDMDSSPSPSRPRVARRDIKDEDAHDEPTPLRRKSARGEATAAAPEGDERPKSKKKSRRKEASDADYDEYDDDY